MANDWLQDSDDYEEGQEITEEDFAGRIVLDSIGVSGNGNFNFWFSDDDMFWGHSVCVNGNIESGPQDAEMCG